MTRYRRRLKFKSESETKLVKVTFKFVYFSNCTICSFCLRLLMDSHELSITSFLEQTPPQSRDLHHNPFESKIIFSFAVLRFDNQFVKKSQAFLSQILNNFEFIFFLQSCQVLFTALFRYSLPWFLTCDKTDDASKTPKSFGYFSLIKIAEKREFFFSINYD